MTCPRCQGLMVERPLCERDWRHAAARWTTAVYVWACVNCGNYQDAVIAMNHANQARLNEEMQSKRYAYHWEKTLADAAKAVQEVA